METEELTITLSGFAAAYCKAGSTEAGMSPEAFAASIIEFTAEDDMAALGSAGAIAAGEPAPRPGLYVVVGDAIKRPTD
ncbi:hypothetical protein [Ruegeria arenilitoris]|uniref:hypothetical protein n=1 Tax=Ruegeria arenilitoris TaxID=1173585 RepID=UPI00147FF200|nr:hypothetical protein [Ruegeria arenilitoris]